MSKDPRLPDDFRRRLVAGVVTVTGTVLVIWIAWNAIDVLLLAFAGVLLAVLLDGLARFVARHTPLRRTWALGLVLLCLLGGTVGFWWLVGPSIAEQFEGLREKVPQSVERLREALAGTAWGRDVLERVPDWDEVSPDRQALTGGITGFFSTAAGVVSGLAFVLLAGLYGALRPELYTRPVVRLVAPAHRARAEQVLGALGHVLQRWLVGRFASMAVVGALTTIGLWIVGLPVALSLGVIAGALSFVPFIGPILAAVPGLLVGLLEGPTTALWVLLVYVIVETIESNFVSPFIEHRAVSVPPAAVIFAQFVMGTLVGMVGIFVATPLTVLIVVLVQMLYVEDVLGDDITILGDEH